MLSVSGAGVASLNVLANDSDPNNDAMTVAIVDQPSVGRANVNSNGTVRLDDLPAGFRGFTRFTYRVSDTAGAQSGVATAGVFVDATPFRLAFVADEARNGAADLFVSDLVSAPQRVATLLQGSLRQLTFRASRTGATLAYTRADPQNVDGTIELWVVRTQPAAAPVRVTLPAGATLLRQLGEPQYALSPDGNWLALVAGAAGTDTQTLHLLDVRTGGAPTAVAVAEAPVASRIEFAADSRFVHWLGRATQAATAGAVYRLPVDRSTAPVRLSAAPAAGAGIVGYTVLRTQPRLIAGRTGGGGNAIVALDPATPGTETVLSHAPTGGETIEPGAITLSPDETRFTYAAVLNDDSATWLGSTTAANARLLIARSGDGGARPAAFSPDSASLLFLRRAQGPSGVLARVFETPLASSTPTLVTEGLAPLVNPTQAIFFGYDGTANRIVIERGVEASGQAGNEVRVVPRSAFGGAGTKLGAASANTPFRNYAAISRGIVILAESAFGQAGALQPALVNVTAPDRLLPLTPGVVASVAGSDFLLLEPTN